MVEEISLALSFLFSRKHPKPVLVKLRSRTRQPLDRREIWTPSLKPIFTHPQHWDLRNNVCGERNFALTGIVE